MFCVAQQGRAGRLQLHFAQNCWSVARREGRAMGNRCCGAPPAIHDSSADPRAPQGAVLARRGGPSQNPAFSASFLDPRVDNGDDTVGSFEKSMHPIFSSLFAAALLGHALLGCCWHHAYRCVRCETTAAEVSPAMACCRHHADEHQRTDQVPAGPCKCHFECCGPCTYLPTPKAPTEKHGSDSPIGIVPPSSALTAHLDAASAVGQFAGSPGHAEPPLRLHLLHQILLI